MIYDEYAPYVGDDHVGDTVTLVSNVGGRKDKKFSRNYAWAKHAADRGKISTIVVKVVANGEAYRTVDAFKRAVGKPHTATRVFVDGPVEHAMAILDSITAIVPSVSDETPAEAPVDSRRKGRKPAPKVEVPEEPVEVVVDEPQGESEAETPEAEAPKFDFGSYLK